MSDKKNMRRISVLVTAQTAYNLDKLAAMCGELEWASYCRGQGYDCRRTAQYCGNTGDASDVVGLPGIHQEVKRVERLDLEAAMAQAKHDAPPWEHGLLLPDQPVSMAAGVETRAGLDGQETDVCCWEKPGRAENMGDYIRHRELPKF